MESSSGLELNVAARDKWKRIWLDVKFQLLGKISALVPGLRQDALFDGLQSFCCFIGHGRSGGTLVGALLNAHPDIVISNELNALRRLRRGMPAGELYRVIAIVSRRQARRGSKGGGGYSYQVAGQWQGRCRNLKVIGDRKAGATAAEIVNHPEILDLLDREVRLTKRFVHVVRHPLDNITTTYRKTVPRTSENSVAHLTREINNYAERCTAVSTAERRFGSGSVHFVYHEDLIGDPRDQLAKICRFLEVGEIPDYLDACAAIVRTEPHESRWSISWDDEAKDRVRRIVQQFHWLNRYVETI